MPVPTEVTVIPNEPAICVFVTFKREMTMRFGPHAGKTIEIPVQLVGVSAREVSAEASETEAAKHPVKWRFLAGKTRGGDDPKREPPWTEYEIEVDPTIHDAREILEDELSVMAKDFHWYLLPKPEKLRIE